MDSQTAIESVSFFWGIAFVVNVIIGMLSFGMLMRRMFTGWMQGCICWMGWWSWANALTLLVNWTVGPMSPFAYHQIGIFTESMFNIGVIWWGVVYSTYNWHVRTDEDWSRIERLRIQITKEHLDARLREKTGRESHDDSK